LGSIYPFDAHLNGTSFASWWLRTDADRGDVIVLHDGPERGLRAAQILGVVLPDLAAKGLRAVTLSELVAARTPGS
ncbi:MAG: peptidoglycan-N-acetylglucosamine deacetylase, partial [Myxococcota bacterium]